MGVMHMKKINILYFFEDEIHTLKQFKRRTSVIISTDSYTTIIIENLLCMDHELYNKKMYSDGIVAQVHGLHIFIITSSSIKCTRSLLFSVTAFFSYGCRDTLCEYCMFLLILSWMGLSVERFLWFFEGLKAHFWIQGYKDLN